MSTVATVPSGCLRHTHSLSSPQHTLALDASRTRQPAALTNAPTLASGDELAMSFVPFRALFLTNFLERRVCELRLNRVLGSSK